MEKLFINGKIHCYDRGLSVVDSMGIEEGKIVFTGSAGEGGTLAGKDCEIIDLSGKVVLPAFTDAHLHIQAAAYSFLGAELASCQDNIAALQEAVRGYIESHPGAEVTKGFGWVEYGFPGRGPHKSYLDEISTEIPIILISETGHTGWLNSKALEMAGITRDTVTVGTGVIERDDDGEPWGAIRNDTLNIALEMLPDFSVREYKKCCRHFFRYCASLGVTGYLEALTNWCGPNLIEALKEMAGDGELDAYVRGTYCVHSFRDVEEQAEKFAQLREKDKVNEHFQINTLKFFEDGAYGVGRTAYILEPYFSNPPEDPDYRSAPLWPQEKLNRMVIAGMEKGFQIHIHCIGDAAVREAINAFENAGKEKGLTGRNVIAHVENLHKDDLPRMKPLGIVPVVHPIWAEWDIWNLCIRDIIGEKMADELWPINSLIQEGLICAAATDFPALAITPTPPLVGIEQSVTRAMSKYFHPCITDYGSGKYDKPLGDPSERTTLDDAVKMYTVNGAYSIFTDGFRGSIEAGKNADFVVLDQDIYSIAAGEISNTKVLNTYLKGIEIYSLERDGILNYYE